MDTLATYCELSPRMPPAKETRITTPRFFRGIMKCKDSAEAFDLACKVLSQFGFLTDQDQYPGLVEKMEKLRGKA